MSRFACRRRVEGSASAYSLDLALLQLNGLLFLKAQLAPIEASRRPPGSALSSAPDPGPEWERDSNSDLFHLRARRAPMAENFRIRINLLRRPARCQVAAGAECKTADSSLWLCWGHNKQPVANNAITQPAPRREQRTWAWSGFRWAPFAHLSLSRTAAQRTRPEPGC